MLEPFREPHFPGPGFWQKLIQLTPHCCPIIGRLYRTGHSATVQLPSGCQVITRAASPTGVGCPATLPPIGQRLRGYAVDPAAVDQ